MRYSTRTKVCVHASDAPPKRVASRSTLTISNHHNSMPRRSFGQEISGNRRAGCELSDRQKDFIISKWEEGWQQKQIAAEINCHRNAIGSWIKRYKIEGHLHTRPRSGRPPITSHREDRALFREARKAPKTPYSKLVVEAQLDSPSPLRTTTPSRRTLYRRLKRFGIRSYRAIKRPKLKAYYIVQRLYFARLFRYFNWRRRIVKFSDKCLVQRGSGIQAL